MALGIPLVRIEEWLVQTMEADPARGHAYKPWKLTPARAKKLIALSLTQIREDDDLGKDVKRARDRALSIELIRRLMAKGSVSALSAAGRVLETLCKIDGAFDPSMAGGNRELCPATDEEAAILIKHATAVYELAQRRGVIASPKILPVIDIQAEEPTDDEDDYEDESTDDGRPAN